MCIIFSPLCYLVLNGCIIVPSATSSLQEGISLLAASPSSSSEGSSVVKEEGGVGGMWVSGREAGGLPWEEVARLLTTDPSSGLSSREVLTRRQIAGYNEFSEAPDDPLWKKYLGQVSVFITGFVCLQYWTSTHMHVYLYICSVFRLMYNLFIGIIAVDKVS